MPLDTTCAPSSIWKAGVTAYCLEELFAEKTRALHERMRPRDLYDVVQLVDNYAPKVDFSVARALFRAKCSVKGIATPSSASFLAQLHASAELEAEWGEMLAHQLPTLPPLDGIRVRLPAALAWIDEPAHTLADAPAFATVPIAAPSVPLPRVNTRQGEEPEMSGLAVTERTFVPRYSIELSGIAQAPVHPWRPAPRGSGRASFGQTYVFQCPQCQKTFRHTHNDPSLRVHKHADGYGNCAGRRGYLLHVE